jgi:cysteine desulfurase/selenocysteine lyase
LIDGAGGSAFKTRYALDCDFYVFSGHKYVGQRVPEFYTERRMVEQITPYQGGGEMIKDVSFEKTTYAELPHKFEAGTPNIAGGIALGTAVDYMNEVGFDNIQQQENELLAYGTARLLEIEGLKIYGTAAEKTSVISFNIEGIHPYDWYHH